MVEQKRGIWSARAGATENEINIWSKVFYHP